jgi:hypothetical protein
MICPAARTGGDGMAWGLNGKRRQRLRRADLPDLYRRAVGVVQRDDRQR